MHSSTITCWMMPRQSKTQALGIPALISQKKCIPKQHYPGPHCLKGNENDSLCSLTLLTESAIGSRKGKKGPGVSCVKVLSHIMLFACFLKGGSLAHDAAHLCLHPFALLHGNIQIS